jgi:hypothetical protein
MVWRDKGGVGGFLPKIGEPVREDSPPMRNSVSWILARQDEEGDMSDDLTIYEGLWRDKFRAAISARLSASARLRSRTLTGAELYQIYLDKVPGESLTALCQSPDLIILDLGIEPRNRYLGEVLACLINDRLRWHLPTVINSRYPISSEKFVGIYGRVFVDFLIEARQPKAPVSLDLSDFCIRD